MKTPDNRLSAGAKLLIVLLIILNSIIISSCQSGCNMNNRSRENPAASTNASPVSEHNNAVNAEEKPITKKIPPGYDRSHVKQIYSHLESLSTLMPPENQSDKIIIENVIRFGYDHKFKKIKPLLPELLRMADETPGRLELVGMLAMDFFDNDTARAAFEQVLKSSPDNVQFVQSRILLGHVLIESGKMKEAISHLKIANEQLAQMQDDGKEFPIIFGMIIDALDNKDTGLRKTTGMPREELESELEKKPEEPSLHIRAAAISMSKGDFNTARKEIKTALDLLEKNLNNP